MTNVGCRRKDRQGNINSGNDAGSPYRGRECGGPEPPIAIGVIGALTLVQDGFDSVRCEPGSSGHAHIVLQRAPMPAATGCAQSLRSETAGWDGKSSVQEPAGGGV
jgi:hypothetical protein